MILAERSCAHRGRGWARSRPRPGLRRQARDRAPEAAARQGPARAVRADQRAGQEAHRSARAAAGRARGDGGRGRGGGRAREAAHEPGTVVAAHVRRKRPARRPLPEHLPRERVVVPAPTTCRCCGGSRLAKVGEVVTETLDVVPRRWFVRQTVREKFTCRDCETIPSRRHPSTSSRAGGSAPACWR